MRIFQLFHNRNVVQLDIEILVHALERAPKLDIILQLNGDLLVNQGLEKAVNHVSLLLYSIYTKQGLRRGRVLVYLKNSIVGSRTSGEPGFQVEMCW